MLPESINCLQYTHQSTLVYSLFTVHTSKYFGLQFVLFVCLQYTHQSTFVYSLFCLFVYSTHIKVLLFTVCFVCLFIVHTTADEFLPQVIPESESKRLRVGIPANWYVPLPHFTSAGIDKRLCTSLCLHSLVRVGLCLCILCTLL